MAEGTRKDPLEYQREYNEFMYKLRKFLASKDMPMKKLPLFGGEEIDLYLLYKTVTNFGGWLKVTDEKKWHEVAKCFNLPPSCLNSAFALRQLYVRYLEAYEKIYFLGEDGDDSSFPRLNFYNPGHNLSHPSSSPRDPQRNFERLVLSLQSGLPNEVDFAINICMLLSNVNNSVFNLAKAPAIIDMALAHVGVFLEDSYGSSDLYKEWYKNSGKDFKKFWRRVLNCEEIKELLPGDEEDPSASSRSYTDEIFNLDKTAAHADFEFQRVVQVCTILHNFSFDKMDASVLSSHPVCLRFLLFCLHCNIGSLKKLATDTMTNLADKLVLEPLESLNCQLFFLMIDRYIRSPDRYDRISAMNILKRICLVEDNQDAVCQALDIATYESLIKILILEDIQLLVPALETLYPLTGLGQLPCDLVVSVRKSIEILVSIVNVCVEAFGANMLSQVKVVDNFHGVAAVAGTFAAKQSLAKVLVSSPEQVQRSEGEFEALAQHWLKANYDVDPANTILQRDLYAEYLTSLGKLSRNGVLNSASFHKILRFVFPDLQVVKLNTGSQQLYGLVGIRKKVSTEALSGPTTVNPGQRAPLCRTPTPPLHASSPLARTGSPPVNMESTYVKMGHGRRPPTPPVQRDTHTRTGALVSTTPPGLPMAVQSSSLPGTRHDLAVDNILSSANVVQPSIVQPTVQAQTLSSIGSAVQTTTSQVLSAADARNNPVMTSPFSGTAAIVRHFDATNNSPGDHVIRPGPQGIQASSSVLTQRNVSTADITAAGLPSVFKPDVVQGSPGTTNGVRDGAAGSITCKNPSPFPVVVISAPSQAKSLTSNKGVVVVNGEQEHLVSKTKEVPSGLAAGKRFPTVNGSQVNGDCDVLYVAKEERATKMAHQAHEVVISVVENPTKPSAETESDLCKATSPTGVVTDVPRKRSQSSLGDAPRENSKIDPFIVNGPFVASEMLRSVAKRQRCNSEGGSLPLVNGVGSGGNDQKDPMAWDEVAMPHQKSIVSSPKMPIAVNGIRMDVVTHHAGIAGSKATPGTSVINTVHTKANSVLPVYDISRNMTNAMGGAVPSQPSVNSNLGPSDSGSQTRRSTSSVVVVSLGQNTSAQAVVVNRNSVASVPSTTVVVPASSTPEDRRHSNEVHEEQAVGSRGLYRCMWNGCGCSFANSKLLYNHAVSTHAPADQLFTSCQWEGCSNVRRSRASLLFHLRQRHLNPSSSITKEPNVVPKPQTTPPGGPGAPAQSATPPVYGRPAYPPHPSVNPLLMSLKEQLLQTEPESPVTKSVRLTAALILRNIAKYSPTGRRKLKRYESSFSEIMCSKLESNTVMASCLHEMTRKRQESETVRKR